MIHYNHEWNHVISICRFYFAHVFPWSFSSGFSISSFSGFVKTIFFKLILVRLSNSSSSSSSYKTNKQINNYVIIRFPLGIKTKDKDNNRNNLLKCPYRSRGWHIIYLEKEIFSFNKKNTDIQQENFERRSLLDLELNYVGDVFHPNQHYPMLSISVCH